MRSLDDPSERGGGGSLFSGTSNARTARVTETTFRAQAGEVSVTLVVDADEGLPVRRRRPHQSGEVVANLLSNSLRHTHGRTITIAAARRATSPLQRDRHRRGHPGGRARPCSSRFARSAKVARLWAGPGDREASRAGHGGGVSRPSEPGTRPRSATLPGNPAEEPRLGCIGRMTWNPVIPLRRIVLTTPPRTSMRRAAPHATIRSPARAVERSDRGLGDDGRSMCSPCPTARPAPSRRSSDLFDLERPRSPGD